VKVLRTMTRRRGFTILELFVATSILVVLMGVCLKWFTAAATQRRAAEYRQAAMGEAANVMERLAAQPWDEMTGEKAAKWTLSSDARQHLPQSALAVQITQPPAEPGAKQVVVTVRWRARPETPESQVRLVAWRFRAPTGP